LSIGRIGFIKYAVCLNVYATVVEVKAGTGAQANFYNEERQHYQSLGTYAARSLRGARG
jgi:hypothetical protein